MFLYYSKQNFGKFLYKIKSIMETGKRQQRENATASNKNKGDGLVVP